MAANARSGLMALYKRGWNEIPEIMTSSIMGVIGLGITIYSVNRYYANDGDNRRYKDRYTVYRHDDPRVPNIKRY